MTTTAPTTDAPAAASMLQVQIEDGKNSEKPLHRASVFVTKLVNAKQVNVLAFTVHILEPVINTEPPVRIYALEIAENGKINPYNRPRQGNLDNLYVQEEAWVEEASIAAAAVLKARTEGGAAIIILLPK